MFPMYFHKLEKHDNETAINSTIHDTFFLEQENRRQVDILGFHHNIVYVECDITMDIGASWYSCTGI